MNLSEHHQMHDLNLAREATLAGRLEQRRVALERIAEARAAAVARRGPDAPAPASSGAAARSGLRGLRALLDRLGHGWPPASGPRPAH